MKDERVVLCGANTYEKKYYFNANFKAIPQSIQDELRIICILYTEEVGGIFTLVFEENGYLSLETQAYEEDILYDAISAGLLIKKIQSTNQELFESISLFYNVITGQEGAENVIDN